MICMRSKRTFVFSMMLILVASELIPFVIAFSRCPSCRRILSGPLQRRCWLCIAAKFRALHNKHSEAFTIKNWRLRFGPLETKCTQGKSPTMTVYVLVGVGWRWCPDSNWSNPLGGYWVAWHCSARFISEHQNRSEAQRFHILSVDPQQELTWSFDVYDVAEPSYACMQ